MATHMHPTPHGPLLDPDQFEEAGRTFRVWLERLFGHTEPKGDTSIAWEDGEPKTDLPDQTPPRR